MLTHNRSNTFKQQLSTDHDLTELSWLTRSDIFGHSSSNTKRPTPVLSRSLPTYGTNKSNEIPRHHQHHSSSTSLIDSSDSEQDNDSSSLNSSSERVTTNFPDNVSPPHSALCFWILFAIEESRTRSLTLNEICDWIEQHIEQQQPSSLSHTSTSPISDEQLIRSTRLKSKIRYHMTKQISFFVKIIKDPVNDIKLRYPLWTTDPSKRALLLDTLLTMNVRQLSLTTQYTMDIYERLCSERRQSLLRNTNDENSCPILLLHETKRDKIIHRLGSCEESNANNKRKKQRSKHDSSTTSTPSVEVVDAAMTLLLLRQTK
ncbi:unnamed protein product [Adineta ricciae]|uniref:Uncharacterized protein n=1 Tax=Adineta ricciae TaxID=249248 RepID=A0A814S7G4_ADIRI|nr:unnamed protein product [Adineta ricciae]